MRKRFTSFLWALGMILLLLPETALAAGTSGTTASNGSPLHATWYLDESGKILTLRGTGEMGNGILTGSLTVETVIIEEGITSIGNKAFDGFEHLSSVTLPNSMTTIGQDAFSSCENLAELILPDAITTIGSGAFEGCRSLTEMVIPEKVKEIGENTFRGCYTLEQVTIPNGMLSIGDRAFSNCSKLADITIPNTVTSIGEHAFYDCYLLDIEIPSQVNHIGKNAFGFTSLRTVTIPNGISLINELTFQYCQELSAITIPASVVHIGDFAFSGCSGLKDVYFKGSQAQWEQIEIGRSNDYLTSATIHFLGEEAQSYSLRFYPNGGTGNLPEPAFYTEGEIITLPTAPLRDGYIFAGWSDGQKTYQAGEQFTMPEKNVTLTARWTPYTPPVYPMLSYDLNGGTGTFPDATPYTAGTTVKISDVIPIHHNVFLGWYCADRPEQVYLPEDSFVMPDHDVVLRAVWGSRIPILEYNLNEGTAENIPQAENVLHGEMVIVTMTTPVREGYRFIGWSDKKDGGSKIYSPGGFFSMPNMDTILFAQWKELYSLEFKLDGGTGIVPDPAYCVEGELVTLPEAPSKEGFVFDGWFDGQQPYPAGSQFTMPGNPLILTAKWREPMLDLTPYLGNKGYDTMANFWLLSESVAEKEREAFLNAILGTSLKGASDTDAALVHDRVYNLLFNATYRPQKFGGKDKEIEKYPRQNDLGWSDKIIKDDGLNFCVGSKKIGTAVGCLAFARASSCYIYQDSSRTVLSRNGFSGGADIRNLFQREMVPGEAFGYEYHMNVQNGKKSHALLYLGEDPKHTGFYFLSYGGGLYNGRRYDNIDVGFATYDQLFDILSDGGNRRDYRIYINNMAGGSLKELLNVSFSSHCPVEMMVTVDDKILDSRTMIGPGHASNEFASMTTKGNGQDREVFVEIKGACITNGTVEIRILGTGVGTMTLVADYEYSDSTVEKYTFLNVPVTASTTGTTYGTYPGSALELYMTDTIAPEISNLWSVNPGEIADTPLGPDPLTSPSRPTGTTGSSGGNSSSRAISYTISVPSNTSHGTVRISPSSAQKGDTVTITVEPDTSYELKKLNVTDSKGNELKLTDKGDGKFTFTMPNGAVTINAVFETTQAQPKPFPFTDVTVDDWCYEAVEYAYNQGIMNGTTETTFTPNGLTTRGMIVTILHRLEGTPSVSTLSSFSDVAMNRYCTDAVVWGAANGIVYGYQDGTFHPDVSISRQQMVTILYRYAQLKEYDTSGGVDISSYPDNASVASYAREAMAWAVGNGIVAGTSDGQLNPTGMATRAQFAVIMYRFGQKVAG